MKKTIFILANILFISICFIIYSCSKQSESLSPKKTIISNDLIQAAKDWQKRQTHQSATLRVNATKSTIILPPNWKEAKLNTLSNGKMEIIVPGPDFKLSTNSTVGFIRKFVFTEEQGTVTGGRIVEVYGAPDYISANINTLLENYTDGKMNNFTGAIISYDVNYNYIASEVYKNGYVVDANSWVRKGAGQPTTANNRIETAITTLSTCTNWFWVTHWSDGTTTEQYLYTTCTGGGDTEGGGGGGNYTPPEDLCSSATANFQNQINVLPVNGSENILSTNTSGYTRTRVYNWVFAQSAIGVWSYTSTENGTHSYDGTNWRWVSLTHGGISMSGIVIGGTFSISVVNSQATLGLYNALMSLTWSTTASFVCAGSPVNLGSGPYTTSCAFNSNH